MGIGEYKRARQDHLAPCPEEAFIAAEEEATEDKFLRQGRYKRVEEEQHQHHFRAGSG